MPSTRRTTLFLLFAAALGLAQSTPPPRPQLVQSVPSETALADPALPFARDVWPAMIAAARRRIDLAHFYATNGPDPATSALEPTLKALEAAGARGVKIRFLLATSMLQQEPATLARLRAIPGAELRSFDFGPGVKGILHTKYFLVDGEEAFVGSQNFDWRALQHIHETGLRFRNPELVRPLAAVFEKDWAFAGGPKAPLAPHKAAPQPTPDPPPAYELVASPPSLNPPGVRPALDALVQLLAQARTRIRIQLLSYSPVTGRTGYWPILDQMLRAAAVRGVQVQLLVSDWNLEVPAVHHLQSLATLPNLEVRVAAIPEASTGHIPFARVAHSKLMTLDGSVLWLGTSNWSQGYFSESRNVELIARDAALAGQADAIFERLWTSRYCSRLEPGKNYPPRKRD